MHSQPTTLLVVATVLVLATCADSLPAADDLLVADFEGDDYATWTVAG